MRKIIFLLFLSLVSIATAQNYAVLVAGSNSWFNYRHQADVLHAYKMLEGKNFKKENIIVFAYDDIANNTRNPFPGKVFNKPTYADPGVDVYAGVKIDYSGATVTPQNFLNVLSGRKSEMVGVGSGRVLEMNSNDNLMIFFSDHGAPNLIAFPSKYLYADQLMATFASMKGNYNKIAFYLQSCQSGSMFVNLPTDTKIYALSAANPKESSWGCYCSPDDVIQGQHIGTCLGDLFSCKFIEDAEGMDLSQETLQTQFEKIRALTTLSHVMQWGDVSFIAEAASDFIGPGNDADKINLRKPLPPLSKLYFKNLESNIDSRYMKIKVLSQIYKREKTEAAYKQMRQEMQDMQKHDNIFTKLSSRLHLSGDYSPRTMNYDCMRAVMDNHTEKCGRLSDYGLVYAKYYAEACERYSVQKIILQVSC